jgi:hypothetical protein
MIRDGGINLLLPSGLVEAREQIVFNHVTFADAPPPHRDSVWVQGGDQEVVFTDCSFDQAQFARWKRHRCWRAGGGQGSPFENPNFAWPGSSTYDYVVVDSHPGNLLRLSDSYFLQDASADGPKRFVALNGGRLVLCGIGTYTPAGSPLKNFAMVGPRAAVDTYGFNNLSGDITDGLLGRTLF